MSTALEKLILTYHELNSSVVDELTSEPSPLEFMRYVARNRPFVVRGGAADWPALHRWNMDYLLHVMGSSSVNVAITPAGNADSVTTNPLDGKTYFVKPLEKLEPFRDFLCYVQKQEKAPSAERDEVKYAQTQNDNLRDEYSALYSDVEADIAWARIALEKEPDAINLWIGNSRSVTALHRDNYENIYCQIIGSKHFVLLPPVAMPCVNEQMLQPATYAVRCVHLISNVADEFLEQRDIDQGAQRVADTFTNLIIKPDEDADVVPFALWDPDRPAEYSTPFSKFSKPLHVDLNPGDMLYLPSLWYHKVSQTSGNEGICCAVNYWYDMDFSGSAYPISAFIREIALSPTQTTTH